jgi:hypothetical protein
MVRRLNFLRGSGLRADEQGRREALSDHGQDGADRRRTHSGTDWPDQIASRAADASTPAFYTWLQRAYLREFNVSIIRFGDRRMKLNRKTLPVRQWQEIQLLSQRRGSPRRGACIQQVRRRLLNT